MIKPIELWPASILSTKCKEVTEFDDTLVQKVLDLTHTLEKTRERAMALAAPQIGYSDRIIAHLVNPAEVVVLINPVILQSEGETNEPEGCISLPGISIKVKRASQITIQYQDINGKKIELIVKGLLARCIQHEVDHLDGKVFIYQLSKLKRDFITAKMKKFGKKLKQQEKRFHEWKRVQGRDSRDNDLPIREESGSLPV